MEEPLLDFLGVVMVPGITETFAAKDKFVMGEETNISLVGGDFWEYVLSEAAEEPSEPSSEEAIGYADTRLPLADIQIVAQIAAKVGELPVVVKSSQIFAIVKTYWRVLLTDGRPNVFWVSRGVRGAKGAKAVSIRRSGEGWNIGMRPLRSTGKRCAGCRVFFPG